MHAPFNFTIRPVLLSRDLTLKSLRTHVFRVFSFDLSKASFSKLCPKIILWRCLAELTLEPLLLANGFSGGLNGVDGGGCVGGVLNNEERCC